jgi:hypothetical protein
VAGAAAHIASFAAPCDSIGETGRQFAFDRQVVELVEFAAAVLVRQRLIAFADRLREGIRSLDFAGAARALLLLFAIRDLP